MNVWFGRFDEALWIAAYLQCERRKWYITKGICWFRDTIDDQIFVDQTKHCQVSEPSRNWWDRKAARSRRVFGTYWVDSFAGASKVSYCVWCNTVSALEDTPLILYFHGDADSSTKSVDSYPL